MYFKLLNLPDGHPYAEVKLNVALTVNGHPKYFMLAKVPMQQLKFGWTEISGDFYAQEGATVAYPYIEIPDISVNYLVDFASAQELPHNSHWMPDAQKRINSIRKAPVSFKLAHGVNAHGISIELIQMKRDFAFGTAVVAQSMTNQSEKGYQDFVYKNFEWTVFEGALKWLAMQWSENHFNLDRALNAISALKSHGQVLHIWIT
ncbi:uncharacterized protein LOC134244817 [Saccostrea cucullata]|uniref:uncharacterized protein LOC134244817 n=1 Tax=Saccostrea cuccullata TaxID=36930 RepID=UPI002ED329B9